MIFSLQQLFSNDQAITATANSTNVIDLGATGTVLGGSNALVRDIGKGTPVPILVQVTETFLTLDSLKVKIQTSHVEGFGEAYTANESEAILAATLVAGYMFTIQFVPLEVDKRFVRLVYTVAGSNATAGKITAGIVAATQQGTLGGVSGIGGT